MERQCAGRRRRSGGASSGKIKMGKSINLVGISDTRTAPAASRLADGIRGQSLIVTPSENRAKRLAQDLSFFVSVPVYVWPDVEPGALRYEAKSTAELGSRLQILERLCTGDPCVIVAPVMGILKKLPPRETYESEALHLSLSSTIDRNALVRRLSLMGYERADIVESTGQFAARGDIVDVFPPGREHPLRIELFDEEVDSLRQFDARTQRSLRNLDRIDVYPAQLLVRNEEIFGAAVKRVLQAYRNALPRQIDEEAAERLKARREYLIDCIEEGVNLQYLEHFIAYFYQTTHYLWEYIVQPGFVMIDDPVRMREVFDLYDKESEESRRTILERGEGVPEDFRSLPEWDGYVALTAMNRVCDVYYCTPFTQQIPGKIRPDEIRNVTVRQAPSFNGHMELLESELSRCVDRGYRVTVVCSSAERLTHMSDCRDRSGLTEGITLRQGILSRGFEDEDEKILFISESDIFPHTKQRRRQHRESGREIRTFSDIRKGDYVVHENHGIGRFTGVEKLEIQGGIRDYLKIRYAGEDVLYIPVDQMGSIQKYVGSDSITPRVHRLSGGEWHRVKARAREAIAEMAAEFLELAARREQTPGNAFGEDSTWQKEFEEAFEFEETADQLSAAEEIKRDMQSPRAMDRLLCGDVGYGKTEVAARAIFKCLEQGKQAVILAPTTLLANQHFHTLGRRLSSYPFRVEMLSRFRSERQQEKIIEQTKTGEIDLLIGTHRLLSGDVTFKDLGLLVVDEEQRFGVQHKEVIKKLKESVDVLTLSATPIPRTLHLSLIGVRNMSVIEEPPEDRYPVQTYVVEQDDLLLRDVIRRELGRGGQVFVVYNRVRGIRKMAAQIGEWVPEARIAVGHGQMGERELEDVMIGYVEGAYDVLVSTTIIESGLDIPNANTIIILDADRLGLSQLYQLRGRVGRSSRLAYAYLVYRKDKVLSEIAEKRLRAIREFTEFGAGFHVAMRDLELRGAGNILGTEQSGHMLSIGYEMYCKLVEEVVSELQGRGTPESGPRADTSIELSVPAYLPETYIADELTRLSVYKRIALIRDHRDRSDMLDELTDRFGDLPKEAENLLDVARIRSMASSCGVGRIVLQHKKLVFLFEKENVLSPEVFALLLDTFGHGLTIYGGVEPRIAVERDKRSALIQTLDVLERMTESSAKENR